MRDGIPPAAALQVRRQFPPPPIYSPPFKSTPATHYHTDFPCQLLRALIFFLGYALESI